MRRPNHASRFEGIPKTKLQASSASDPETLQSQVTKTARKRLSLRGLEVLHGRRVSRNGRDQMRSKSQTAWETAARCATLAQEADNSEEREHYTRLRDAWSTLAKRCESFNFPDVTEAE